MKKETIDAIRKHLESEVQETMTCMVNHIRLCRVIGEDLLEFIGPYKRAYNALVDFEDRLEEQEDE